MIEVPAYISLLFGLTVLISIAWFYWATKSKTFLMLAIAWAVFQSILGIKGLYQDTESFPPRIMLFGIFPTFGFMLLMFLTSKGRTFIDSINLKTLTYFHSVRIPVEIVLALLYYQGLVSVYMTYEGTNFDLFSGLSASVVAFLAFRTERTNHKLLLVWNILCLLLLLNVVITAVFAIPSPFQQLSLDQPNVALLYFPFNLLPSVIVPMVLFGHLVAFRQLFLRGSIQRGIQNGGLKE